MNEWTGKLSRIDAIRIIERATDKEDPAWLWSVEDWYDEDTDTLPSIYHVMAALDVTESEYREATGAQNLNWPDEGDSELTTLRARVQELEAELEGFTEDVQLPDIEAITRCRIRVRRIKRLTPPEDSSDE